MNQFKICPECGTKNPPDVLECEHCEFDLMLVPVTDEQQEAAKISAKAKPADKNILVKVCSECGEKNLSNARKCSKCGEDLSDIVATPETAATLAQINSAQLALKSLDDAINFKVEREVVIGREHELKDYLAAKNFVSRRHCRLTLEGDELFIEDLNSANGTYVNNEKIFRKTKLSKGDEVGLGGAVFNGSRQDKAAYFLVV